MSHPEAAVPREVFLQCAQLSQSLSWYEDANNLGDAWSAPEHVAEAVNTLYSVAEAVHNDSLDADSTLQQKNELARKISGTSATLLAYSDDIDIEYISQSVNMLFGSLLDDTDAELDEQTSALLLRNDITEDLIVARSFELNEHVSQGKMPVFVKHLFAARGINEQYANRIYTAVCVLGDMGDGSELSTCLLAIADVITEAVIQVDPSDDYDLNFMDRMKYVDVSAVDRTKIPQSLCRIFNITNFAEYNPSSLVLLYMEYMGMTPRKQAASLIVRSATDWNGALTWNIALEDNHAIARNGVVRVEAQSPYQLVRAILAAKKANGAPFSTLLLATHGNEGSIQLDHNTKTRITRKDLLQYAGVVNRLIERCFTPEAVLHIAACKSGSKKGIAQTIWKLTGHTVTGSRANTAVHFYQPSSGPIHAEYSDLPVTFPKSAHIQRTTTNIE